MAYGVGSYYGPPLNTNSSYAYSGANGSYAGSGFNRLAQTQQAQCGCGNTNGSLGESVGLSPQAQTAVANQQAAQAWESLSLPGSSPMASSPADERQSLQNLNFLRGVGQREGGGLKLHDDPNEPGLSSTQANRAMHNGQPVLFYESGSDEPVSMGSFGDLTAVTQDLKTRIQATQLAAQQQQ